MKKDKTEKVTKTTRRKFLKKTVAAGVGAALAACGEAAGAFSVYFYGTHDGLEITHRMHGRELYAAVALRAALWTIGKPPGLYGIMDVLKNV